MTDATFVMNVTIPSDNFEFIFWANNTGNDFIIKWGDTNQDTVVGTGLPSHTYALAGSYVIEVDGKVPSLNTYSTGVTADMRNSVTSIPQVGDIQVTGLLNGFRQLVNCTHIGKNTDVVATVGSMAYITANSTNLTTIDFSSWDTSAATTLRHGMQSCNISDFSSIYNWDVSGITDMHQLFYYNPLTAFDFTNWDISSLKDFSNTFRDCASLTSITNLQIPISVTRTDNLFSGANILGTLDLSGSDFSSIGNMSRMFSSNSNLVDVDFSNCIFPTGVISASYMYSSCSSIISTIFDYWTTPVFNNIGGIFHSCSSLTDLNTSSWDVSACTTFYQSFLGCNSLNNIDVSDWDVSNVTTLHQAFQACSTFTVLDVSRWNTSSVTRLIETFWNCTSLQDLIGLENWDTSNVIDGRAFLSNSQVSTATYSKVLSSTTGWPSKGINPSLTRIEFGNSTYVESLADPFWFDHSTDPATPLTKEVYDFPSKENNTLFTTIDSSDNSINNIRLHDKRLIGKQLNTEIDLFVLDEQLVDDRGIGSWSISDTFVVS